MESAAQVVGDTIVRADQAATLWINGFHAPWSDAFWLFCSQVEVWIPLYVVVAYVLFRRLGWKRALIALAAIALTTLCCDQGANLFKNWICRLRPSHDAWMLANGLYLPGDAGGMYGFFSGHAANTFGFAAVTYGIFRSDEGHSYRAYGWGIFLWAVLVSLSRVFIGRHFLGDILVGAAVGLLLGYLFALLYRRVAARV